MEMVSLSYDSWDSEKNKKECYNSVHAFLQQKVFIKLRGNFPDILSTTCVLHSSNTVTMTKCEFPSSGWFQMRATVANKYGPFVKVSMYGVNFKV